MKNYKALIIEDKPDKVQGILNEQFSTAEYTVQFEAPETDFDRGLEKLKKKFYDFLILDLKKDPGEEHPGSEIFESIWSGANQFLPVIVFSAYHGDLEIEDHPFIKKFDKTQEQDVINHVKDKILPKLERVSELRKSINQLAREGFRAINLDEDLEIQKYRMASYIKHHLENLHDEETALPPDIQYIQLPKFACLMAGDIIQKIPVAGQGQAEKEYYMVLECSCDMRKLEDCPEREILCKKIVSVDISSNTKKSEIKPRLNDGYKSNLIYLPKTQFLGEDFVFSAVDVKRPLVIKQRLVSLVSSENNVDDFAWRKIASIASPFKERIVSACYNYRARVGVNTLNKEGWF